MAIPDLHSVESMTVRLKELLDRARQLKKGAAIEPPLPVSEFSAEDGLHAAEDRGYSPAHNAVVETAARNLMHTILVRAVFIQVVPKHF